MSAAALIIVAVISLWGPGASETAAAAASAINEAGTCVRIGDASRAAYVVEVSTSVRQGPSLGYWGQAGSFSVAVDYVLATAVIRRGGAAVGVVQVEKAVPRIGIWTGLVGLSGPASVRHDEIGRELGRRVASVLDRECARG